MQRSRATGSHGLRTRRNHRNRETIEVIVDVLRAATFGARKSHIMVRANLNSVRAGQLIQFLISCGLLRIDAADGEGVLYQTTERGLAFIDLFGRIESMLVGEEDRLLAI